MAAQTKNQFSPPVSPRRHHSVDLEMAPGTNENVPANEDPLTYGGPIPFSPVVRRPTFQEPSPVPLYRLSLSTLSPMALFGSGREDEQTTTAASTTEQVEEFSLDLEDSFLDLSTLENNDTSFLGGLVYQGIVGAFNALSVGTPVAVRVDGAAVDGNTPSAEVLDIDDISMGDELEFPFVYVTYGQSGTPSRDSARDRSTSF